MSAEVVRGVLVARDEQRGGTNALLAKHAGKAWGASSKAAPVAALVGHFQSEPVS